jgi:restriction system protein
MPDWKDYQEEAAEFFRSLGLDATTDVTIKGVRTRHDVDVLVKSHHYGFNVTWIVECKHWKDRVSKLHVLALREIVTDVGADRGILLSEAGFQSGAVEAANLTNVQVTSLADLNVTAREQISAVRLRELHDRLEQCNTRYWEIPKEDRIRDDLRPDFGATGYSGGRIIDVCRDLLRRAFIGHYSFRSEDLAAYIMPELQRDFRSPTEIVQLVDKLIQELEAKLTASEAKQPRRKGLRSKAKSKKARAKKKIAKTRSANS